MDLKSFIKATIFDISDSIKELSDKVNNGTIINPTIPMPIATKSILYDGKNRLVERIDFNIAISTAESTEINGKLGGCITVLSAKAGANTMFQGEIVSRINFSIPAALPVNEIPSPSEHFKLNRLQMSNK
jgi:hypothetical protein